MAFFDSRYGKGGEKKSRSEKVPSDVIEKIESATRGEYIYRTALEQAWFINHINYMGYQWHMVDADTGSIEEIDTQVNYRANKLMAAVTHSVAKVTANPPDWDVDTHQTGQAMNSARSVAEKYLEYVWDREDMPLKSKELITNVRVYGTGILSVRWDPNSGERIEPGDFFEEGVNGMSNDIDDLLEVFDGDEKLAREFLEGKLKLKTGDVRIKVLSPFDFYVDEAGNDIQSCRWAMSVQVRGVDQVKERWGAAAKHLTPEVLGTSSGPSYKYRLRQLVSPNVISGGVAQTQIEEACLVKEYWERPGPDTPEGRYIVYANGIVLHSGENPYAGTEAELPFVRIRDMIIPDRFFGQAALEHAIPAQRDYNKGRSDLIMHSFDMAAPKWMAPRGCVTKHSAINRSSSEVLEYVPISGATGQPLKPEKIEGSRGSPLVNDRIQLAEAEIQEIMGVHDVSQGNVPQGVSSGVAIQLLQEGDDTRLGSLMEEMNASFSTLGMMVLDLSKNFIIEQRTFRAIAGDNSIGEVMSFTGTDLNWRNVRVRMGALLSRQRAAKQQMFMELLQYGGSIGLFDPPEMRNSLMAGLGLSSNFTDPSEVHQKRALYENELLQAGRIDQVFITDYQDDQIHLQTLEQRMNEPSFEQLPPEIQQAFHAHRMAHQQQVAMMMQQQLEMQAQVASIESLSNHGPGEGGEKPPPGSGEG